MKAETQYQPEPRLTVDYSRLPAAVPVRRYRPLFPQTPPVMGKPVLIKARHAVFNGIRVVQ